MPMKLERPEMKMQVIPKLYFLCSILEGVRIMPNLLHALLVEHIYVEG